MGICWVAGSWEENTLLLLLMTTGATAELFVVSQHGLCCYLPEVFWATAHWKVLITVVSRSIPRYLISCLRMRSDFCQLITISKLWEANRQSLSLEEARNNQSLRHHRRWIPKLNLRSCHQSQAQSLELEYCLVGDKIEVLPSSDEWAFEVCILKVYWNHKIALSWIWSCEVALSDDINTEHAVSIVNGVSWAYSNQCLAVNGWSLGPGTFSKENVAAKPLRPTICN